MFDRDSVLDALTANCACAGDAAALNSLSDATLLGILNAKAPGSNADVTPGKPVRIEDDEDEENFSVDIEDTPNSTKLDKKGGTRNAGKPPWLKGGKDDDDDEEDEDDMNRNQGVPMSQLLQHATMEDREIWNQAQGALKDKKLGLVNQIIVNVRDNGQRNALGNKYLRLSLADLREMVALVPQPVHNNGRQHSYPLYLGAGGGPVGNAMGDAADQDDILPEQTLNLSKAAN